MKKLDEVELEKLRTLAGARVGQFRDGLQQSVGNPVAQRVHKNPSSRHGRQRSTLRFGRNPIARRSNA